MIQAAESLPILSECVASIKLHVTHTQQSMNTCVNCRRDAVRRGHRELFLSDILAWTIFLAPCEKQDRLQSIVSYISPGCRAQTLLAWLGCYPVAY